jgi:Histidine phosphatase superfamily (branch 1)
MPDPSLTDKGRRQCLALRGMFPRHHDIDLILASPLKRCIETAVLAFGSVLCDSKRKVLLHLVPLAQEINNYPTDIGLSRKELEAEMPTLLKGSGISPSQVVFDDVSEGWNSKVTFPNSRRGSVLTVVLDWILGTSFRSDQEPSGRATSLAIQSSRIPYRTGNSWRIRALS